MSKISGKFVLGLFLSCVLMSNAYAAQVQKTDDNEYVSVFNETSHNENEFYNQSSLNLEETVIDGVRYQISGSNATVLGYTMDIPKNCIIPSQISFNGTLYNVTAVGDSGLYNCSQITELTLPEGLTSIGQSAFAGCTNLQTVNIPSTVDNIGIDNYQYENPFLNCTSLQNINVHETNANYKSIDGVLYSEDETNLYAYPIGKTQTSYTLSNLTKTIASSTFYNAINLENVICSDSLLNINVKAFYNCENLKTIYLGENLQRIESESFAYCTNLERLEFPNTLERFPENSFPHIENLKEYVVADGCQNYYTKDGVLFATKEPYQDVNKIILVAYPPAKTGTYTVPKEVEKIGIQSFWNSIATDITFEEPSNLKEIAWGAFSSCKNLKSIQIPDSVTFINDYTFQNCYNLESVKLSNNITTIPECLFINCESLKTIEIPKNVTTIEENVFSGCTNLKEITVAEENTVFYAQDGILYGNIDGKKELVLCPSAISSTEIEIPADVSKISVGAFTDVSSLEDITIESGNECFKSIDGVLFENTADGLKLHTYPQGKTATNYTVADNVIAIEDYAFYKNKYLQFVDTKNVTELGVRCFAEIKNLKNISIPNVQIINDYSFLSSGLKNITLPKSLNKIGNQILDFCNDLEYIEFLGDVPGSTHISLYGICNGSENVRYVYVPQGKQTDYLQMFGESILNPGAMVVEGTYIQEEDLSDMIDNLPEISEEITEETKENINNAAKAVVRLSSEDMQKLTDEELLKVEELFKKANEAVNIQQNNTITSSNVKIEGIALASGLVEKDNISGNVVITASENEKTQDELLNLEFNMMVDNQIKQPQSPVIITVDLTEEMKQAYSNNQLVLLHRDGQREEKVDFSISNDTLKFRASEFSSYVFFNETKTFDVNYTANQDAVLYIAGYDNNKMVSIQSYNVQAGSSTIKLEQRPEGQMFKAFILDENSKSVGTATINDKIANNV